MESMAANSGPSRTKLRIGIATSGRFHLLDLARELDALGAEVSFYSYVPRKRAQIFGLPTHCHISLLPLVFPLVVLQRLVPWLAPRTIDRLMCLALDAATILRMRHCHVFICMSGMYVQAPRFARWRYGAKVILERGSTHILSQKALLADHPDGPPITSFTIRRELEGYDLADRIAVASMHVVESFASYSRHVSKLILNPYGVDLEQFPLPAENCKPGQRTILFVGQWSYQKGVDILAEAVDQIDDVKLIHVGPVGDIAFPIHARFIHHDPVPQWRLKEFYHRAHVFALASRQDGFGVVLGQALASGLHVVCTDRTGGSDLARLPGLGRLISVVPVGDADALRRALIKALDDASASGMQPITQDQRKMLSWRRYALQYLRFITEMLQGSVKERPE